MADNGIGISPAQAVTGFKPFVQPNAGKIPNVGGAGQGLAIRLQLANRMGWDLMLRSAVS